MCLWRIWFRPVIQLGLKRLRSSISLSPLNGVTWKLKSFSLTRRLPSVYIGATKYQLMKTKIKNTIMDVSVYWREAFEERSISCSVLFLDYLSSTSFVVVHVIHDWKSFFFSFGRVWFVVGNENELRHYLKIYHIVYTSLFVFFVDVYDYELFCTHSIILTIYSFVIQA